MGSDRRSGNGRTTRYRWSIGRRTRRCIGWKNKAGWSRNGECRRRSGGARYYKLTPKGRRQLAAEQSRWKQLVRAVARTMKPVKE
jgi:hypothetical protein